MSYQSLTVVSQDSIWCQWGLFLSMCSCQEASCTRGSEGLRVLPCRPARRFHFQPVQPAQRYQPGPERRQTDRELVRRTWTGLNWTQDGYRTLYVWNLTFTHTHTLEGWARLHTWGITVLKASQYHHTVITPSTGELSVQLHRNIDQTPIIWIHPVHQCLTSRAADKRVILALK